MTAVDSPAHAAASLADDLRAQIDRTLRPLLAQASRVALLDFPNHPNVGDSAIWMGTLQYLRLIGKPPCYTCDARSYSRDRLRDCIGDGVILLSGGGNLGDLWPTHQQLREQVVRDFPRHRIVQLPQSIYFESAVARQQAIRVMNAHPDLVLLLRDRDSLRMAHQHLEVATQLCPDLAFFAPIASRASDPEHSTLWLLREDIESLHRGSHTPGHRQCDWIRDDATVRAAGWLLARWPRSLQAAASSAYEALAAQRLRRGCQLLRTARAVVTDRLHGHILCLMLDIPHVVLDSRTGKSRSFYETWTAGSPLARWADSIAVADRLLPSR